MTHDEILSMQEEMEAAGLGRPDIITDGNIHRFDVPGDGARSQNGWYTVFDDEHPAGVAGSWKSDIKITWIARRKNSLSESERIALSHRAKAAHEQAEQHRAEANRDAAKKAADVLNHKAQLAPARHPYSEKKRISHHGDVRFLQDALVLQVRHAVSDELQSLQFIDCSGNKRFLAGGKVADGCFSIRGDRLKAKAVFLVEGWATGCTVSDVVEPGPDVAVVAAFDAGNLPRVAALIHEANPGARIIIMADNDHETVKKSKENGKPIENKGITAGKKAASMAGGILVYPPDLDGVSDFNDYANQVGKEEVQRLVQHALKTYKPEEPAKPEKEKERKPRPSAVDKLMQIGRRADLFHDENHDTYATVEVNEHRETHPIRSKGFRLWLEREFYRRFKKQPGGQAIQDALSGLEARARFAGEKKEVNFRVAGSLAAGAVYIDLGNDAWEVVKCTAQGWEVQKHPDVIFIRRRGQSALPTPKKGRGLSILRDFLNVDDKGFMLCVAWLVAALLPRGPFIILVVNGEQGSGKSTLSTVLKRILDPSTAPLRSMPKEERDFAVFARNAYILAIDNLSGISGSMSDVLCRVAYGVGFATRELYSNDDEAVFTGSRPVILNGIDDLLHRPDLADRSTVVRSLLLSSDKRREEAEFWSDFHAKHPEILGALLDAVCTGLKRHKDVRLPQLPRMADAARWITACEPALPWVGGEGEFMRVYMEAVGGMRKEALEADDFASALVNLLEQPGRNREMTAGELLDAINLMVGEPIRRQRAWPGNPQGVRSKLQRIAPLLRDGGWDFNREHDPATRRTIFCFRKKKAEKHPTNPSDASSYSQPIDKKTLASEGSAEGSTPGRLAAGSDPSEKTLPLISPKDPFSLNIGSYGDPSAASHSKQIHLKDAPYPKDVSALSSSSGNMRRAEPSADKWTETVYPEGWDDDDDWKSYREPGEA